MRRAPTRSAASSSYSRTCVTAQDHSYHDACYRKAYEESASPPHRNCAPYRVVDSGYAPDDAAHRVARTGSVDSPIRRAWDTSLSPLAPFIDRRTPTHSRRAVRRAPWEGFSQLAPWSSARAAQIPRPLGPVLTALSASTVSAADSARITAASSSASVNSRPALSAKCPPTPARRSRPAPQGSCASPDDRAGSRSCWSAGERRRGAAREGPRPIGQAPHGRPARGRSLGRSPHPCLRSRTARVRCASRS